MCDPQLHSTERPVSVPDPTGSRAIDLAMRQHGQPVPTMRSARTDPADVWIGEPWGGADVGFSEDRTLLIRDHDTR
jgi:hypothetical protein